MTNTKKQLMTAIAMLVVAALALGTSTYAWFISNQDVTVESLTFQAQAVDDITIALTTDAWSGNITGSDAVAGTFKTLVTSAELDALYTAKSAQLTGSALIPASTTDGKNFYRVSDEAGTWTTNATGVSIANKFVNVQNISESSVKAIPLFLKSTTTTSVYLGTGTTVQGANAKMAARIAFVEEGAGGHVNIWAPDTTNHIADHKITTIGDADGITKAVKSGTTVDSIETGILSQNDKPAGIIADLQAGVAKKVMVYIWLEGCDEDCVSTISAQELTVNLQFTTNHV